jgi:phosphatidylglycerophosphate synthase
MTRTSTYIAPNLLSLFRLIIGPCFLMWAPVPAVGVWLVLLFVAAATDLIDGYLARRFRATSPFGGALDTTADKVFILCLALKVTLVGVLPGWLFAVLLGQYVLLAIIGSIYTVRFKKIPVPEIAAHSAAVIAILVALVGVISLQPLATTLLAMLLALANIWHLIVATQRAMGIKA